MGTFFEVQTRNLDTQFTIHRTAPRFTFIFLRLFFVHCNSLSPLTRYWLNLLYKPFFDAKDRWQRAGKQVIAGSRGDNLGRSCGASTVDESEEETISDNGK